MEFEAIKIKVFKPWNVRHLGKAARSYNAKLIYGISPYAMLGELNTES